MPNDARPEAEVELLELRVLDGPNRFFNRPAIKLEFGSETPYAAADVAAAAALALRRLHVALDLPVPRVTARHSHDHRRAAIAFQWRRRARSQAIADAAARIATGASTVRRELRALRAVAAGPMPDLPRPRIPVVAITGTNGKSTTTRLIAHIGSVAGMRVGMTNSDGIYIGSELVEAGDWTGFGGAGRILSEPTVQLAVLETARGGILLRGIGYAANDVAVVTNVSADHLGLQGIDTLDELAEVKGAVTRITKRSGWAVLNADDPRAWRMRRETKGHWYPFTMDPENPRIELALDRGGRAAVVQRGWLVLLGAGRRPQRLVRIVDLPVAFAGLAQYNVANALAAAAAADALGIPHATIAKGLRSFALDTALNPGRLNLFERKGLLVLVDFAHNEAGLAGLLEVCRQLSVAAGRSARRGRGQVRVAIGTAGDRSDEILYGLGLLAGGGADEVVICEKPHYLRGREAAEMNEIMRAGVREAGYVGPVEAFPTELAALQGLAARSRRGDVVAVMTHAERADVFGWLEGEGYQQVDFERLRHLVDA
ncbi:MAG TPA: Mur ligase family protein [Candidatus Limnocylindria bacterium]|nr:Mur ligase family protein [Candidatus Limnocylindria bacterium]